MGDFRNLEVWKRAHELACDVYRLVRDLPASDQFAMGSQLIRAAASIPANIAEGAARGQREFAHFLRVAIASANELESHLLLLGGVGVVEVTIIETMVRRLIGIRRMIARLRAAILRGLK